jgi:flagellar basal-body rod modification protein FlgD
MVSGVSSSTSAATSASSSAATELAGNFNTFLTLLTTQLKNQDPTNPMDTNEFTQQLVQFSQVEQQIDMNKNLETMISMMQAQENSANLNYVGKVVDVNSADAPITDGSSAYWSYELPAGTTTVQYNILDADGNVVRSASASTGDLDTDSAGRIQLTWDGLDNSGNQAPAGTYTLQVTAKDASGKSLDGVNVYSRGYVEGLESVDGQQYLLVNGQHVLPSDVVGIYDPGSSGSDGSSDSSGQDDGGAAA